MPFCMQLLHERQCWALVRSRCSEGSAVLFQLSVAGFVTTNGNKNGDLEF